MESIGFKKKELFDHVLEIKLNRIFKFLVSENFIVWIELFNILLLQLWNKFFQPKLSFSPYMDFENGIIQIEINPLN